MPPSVDALLARQRRGWLEGSPEPVERYLAEHPSLSADEEAILDLVYQEFLLRRELGQSPSLEEYARRFPGCRERLQAQLAFLQAVREVAGGEAGDADPPGVAADWPRVAGYEILGELGRGAMGVVYTARQSNLRRLVALKMLHPGAAGSPRSRERFRREAEQLARLRHPHIVQVYDVGEQDGRPFFAMELVAGASLAEYLSGAPLPGDQAARLVETLARAIHHAHQRGVIHRDLKPGNILLAGEPEAPIGQCVPKIADFGLAKQLDAPGQTHSGMLVGTPAYMAPEQAASQPGAVGPAVDVYSLGAILYELLTGRPPFQAATPLQVLEKARAEEPAPPSRWNAGAARDLSTICLKCLAKEPQRRYASADGLAEDLRRFQAGEPILARPVGPAERGWLWCRRRPVPTGLLAALVLALLGNLGLWYEAAAGKRLAEAERRNADASRRQAEEHVGMLLRLLTANLDLSGSTFLQKPGGQAVSRELLDKAEAACAYLRARRGDDPGLQRLLAMVWTRQGSLQRRRWQPELAADSLSRALALWDGLPAKEARTRESRWGRVCTLWELGKTYGKLAGSAEALPMFEEAYRLCRDLEPADPSADVRVLEASAGLYVGYYLDLLGRAREARDWFDRLRPALQPLLQRPHPAPEILWLPGRRCERYASGPSDPLFAEAAERYEQAYGILRERVQADQNDTDQRSLLSQVACMLVALHQKAGRPDAALRLWQGHLRFREALLKLHPGMLKDEVEVLHDLRELQRLHECAGQREAMLATTREAAAVLARCPDALFRESNHENVYSELTIQLRRYGAPAEALRLAEQFVQRYERLTRREPENPYLLNLLSQAWHWRAKAHWATDQPEETLAALRQAMAVQRQVVALVPASSHHREQLGDLHLRLARKLCELGRMSEAMQAVRERQRLWPGEAERLRHVRRELERWAAEAADPGEGTSGKRREERERYLEPGARVKQELDSPARAGRP